MATKAELEKELANLKAQVHADMAVRLVNGEVSRAAANAKLKNLGIAPLVSHFKGSAYVMLDLDTLAEDEDDAVDTMLEALDEFFKEALLPAGVTFDIVSEIQLDADEVE